jgi:hypothetical protein
VPSSEIPGITIKIHFLRPLEAAGLDLTYKEKHFTAVFAELNAAIVCH